MDLDRQWFKSYLFNVNNTPNFHRNKWVALNYTHFWRKWACFDCRIMGKLNETYINRFDMANKKICYYCNKEMVCVSSKFKAPPKRNVKKWNRLKNQWKIQLPAYCNTIMAIGCM